VGIYAIKPAFRRMLSPVTAAIVRAGISADAITGLGLGFAAAAGVGVWLGRDGSLWLLLVPAGALLRTAANAIDGMVAIATGTARPVGEVFNEVADRLGDAAMFLPILFVREVPPALVAGTVAAALITAYLGVTVKAAGGERVYAGVMGKPDRMLVLGVAAIVAVVMDDPGLVFSWALWIVLAGAVLTFGVRTAEAVRQLGRR